MKPSLIRPVSLLVALTAIAHRSSPQAPNAQAQVAPSFEVATIRLTNHDDGRHWFGSRLEGRQYTTSSLPLSSLVDIAYSDDPTHSTVLTDHSAPKWIDSEQFDIQAKIDEDYLENRERDTWEKLTPKQQMDLVRPMLRQLLQERFHLKLHSESRPTPVYALVQAKGGAHVKEVPAPIPVEGDKMEAQARWMRDNPIKPMPGMILCAGDQCTASATKIGNAVGQIAANAHIDKIVIDETGLTGYYDFVIPFPPKEDEHPTSTVEDALGMRFEKRTIPIQTWVIESADKPSLDGAIPTTRKAQ